MKRMRLLASVASSSLLLSGAIAVPTATATTQTFPQTLTGGGYGTSSWTGIANNVDECTSSDTGFNVGDAVWNVNNLAPGTLGDAFDGTWLLADNIGATDATYYDAPGSEADVSSNVLTTGAASFGGLQVSAQLKAYQDQALLRVLYKFKNPTGAAVTSSFQTESNFGSDSATVLQARVTSIEVVYLIFAV